METSVIDLINRGLPKWPQMLVTGPKLSRGVALEVIRRTDSWFVNGYGCNDRDGDRRFAKMFCMPHYRDFSEPVPGGDYWERCERWKKAWGVIETQYVHNTWFASSFIHGPHGWCHPDGQIQFIDNVGKWPSVAAIRDDWQKLADAFPFLILTATLMDDEECVEDRKAIVSIVVADGEVRLMEPDLGDHEPPCRSMDSFATLFMLPAAQRERYPFDKATLDAWTEMAVAVDAEIS